MKFCVEILLLVVVKLTRGSVVIDIDVVESSLFASATSSKKAIIGSEQKTDPQWDSDNFYRQQVVLFKSAAFFSSELTPAMSLPSWEASLNFIVVECCERLGYID